MCACVCASLLYENRAHSHPCQAHARLHHEVYKVILGVTRWEQKTNTELRASDGWPGESISDAKEIEVARACVAEMEEACIPYSCILICKHVTVACYSTGCEKVEAVE